MSSYIVCEILVFKPVLHKKYSIHQAHSQWQRKSYHDLSIFRTDLFVAYANEANIVNKDSPKWIAGADLDGFWLRKFMVFMGY